MSNVIKSGVQVAFWTGVSKVFGLLRELSIAFTFGSSALADSINVMLRLPNFFRRILSEGAVSSAFIPLLNEKIASSKREAEYFVSQVFSFLFFLVCILVILFELVMPTVVRIVAPGFQSIPGQVTNTVLMCRVAMPYLILVTLVGFFSSVLNALSRFFASAFNPIILSLGIILATVLPFAQARKPLILALALLFSGLAQLAFILWCFRGVALKIPVSPCRVEFKTIQFSLSKLFPASLASSASQIQMLISQSLASFFEGSISILSYAERLYQFPLSIVGVALSSVMLQSLSRTKAEGNQVNDMQYRCLKLVWLLAVPCAVGMIVLSELAVQVIYQHGNFGHESAKKVSVALQLFSLGLPATILTKVLSNSFYIHHDTKALLNITLVGLALNSFFNLAFMYFMGYLGIALGSSLASWIQVYLLFKLASFKGYFLPSTAAFKEFFSITCLGLIMGLSLHVALRCSAHLVHGLIAKLFFLALLTSFGFALYLFGLLITGGVKLNRRGIKVL